MRILPRMRHSPRQWVHRAYAQNLGAQRLGDAVGLRIGASRAHIPFAEGELVLRSNQRARLAPRVARWPAQTIGGFALDLRIFGRSDDLPIHLVGELLADDTSLPLATDDDCAYQQRIGHNLQDDV